MLVEQCTARVAHEKFADNVKLRTMSANYEVQVRNMDPNLLLAIEELLNTVRAVAVCRQFNDTTAHTTCKLRFLI
jgi:hypothetical protein